MTNKPIFVATHPRACSTAFERVFMTRRDILQCVHEPFGDAYYFGPERLAERYKDDQQTRDDSGFSDSTYRTIMERINKENSEGKRLFIKDMAQYFMPPSGKPVSIAPSLIMKRKGVGTTEDTNGVNGSDQQAHSANGTTEEKPVNGDHAGVDPAHFDSTAELTGARRGSLNTVAKQPYDTPVESNNPTVVPTELLKQFHWTFLIRHPANSIPSYYRCCVPPLDAVTGFRGYRSDEAGYEELRRLFDYLRTNGYVGPGLQGQEADQAGGTESPHPSICVIDADDLLDHPEEIIREFCSNVGIDFSPEMLNWTDESVQRFAEEAFEKWKGFHDDALHSKDLKPRVKKHKRTDEEYYAEWVKKYGEEGAEIIKKSVEENVADYEYLKQFCVKVA